MGFFRRIFSRSPAPAPVVQVREITRVVHAQPQTQASAAAVANAFGGGYFDALRPSDNRTPVPLIHPDQNEHWIASNRLLMSALSRYLYDNHPQVGYAVDQFSIYSGPVKPQSAADDAAWTDEAEAYFDEWAKQADFYNRPNMTLWTMQDVIGQGVDLDGDTGIAALRSDDGEVRLAVIPGWRIGRRTGNDKDAPDGVKKDAMGRLLGYVLDNGQFYPKESFFLAYEPSTAWPWRGMSPLRRGLNDARDLSDIKGFTKIGVKWQQAMLAALKGTLPVMEEDWNEEAEGDPTPNEDGTKKGTEVSNTNPLVTDKTDQKVSLNQMLGGDIPVLPPGTELSTVPQDKPGTNVMEFMDSLAGHFAAGSGLPPAFFLDEKLTGPNVRGVLGKAQRRFNKRQDMLARFVEWVWLRVIGDAIARGRLRETKGWQKITFQYPQQLTIDLGDDAAADRDDLASGVKTRQEVFGKRSKDWRRQTTQLFAEEDFIMEKAAAQAKRWGVAIETVLKRWGYEPEPKAQPEPAKKTEENPPKKQSK